MKKFLSSIICLCMIFSLVSVSVQAEENTAATDSAVIYSIYVTIKEPAVGDTPATTGTIRL